MNRGIVIFLVAFVTFATAWVGLVLAPSVQLAKVPERGTPGQRPYTELELEGRRVYMAEGCVYCHTQQVRGGTLNADLQRGWGPRRSHPADYVQDHPVLLGTMRTGPDLTNVGVRRNSAEWHHLHLYDPQGQVPGSVMARYRFLYEVGRRHEGTEARRHEGEGGGVRVQGTGAQREEAPDVHPGLRGEATPGAVPSAGGDTGGTSNQQLATSNSEVIIPTPRARALVAYLLSLDRTYPVEEGRR